MQSYVLLVSYECGYAPDFDYVNDRSRLDDFVVPVRACGPHLAAQLHRAGMREGDALDYERARADECRRPGSDSDRCSPVGYDQRPYREQKRQRDESECGHRQGEP